MSSNSANNILIHKDSKQFPKLNITRSTPNSTTCLKLLWIPNIWQEVNRTPSCTKQIRSLQTCTGNDDCEHPRFANSPNKILQFTKHSKHFGKKGGAKEAETSSTLRGIPNQKPIAALSDNCNSNHCTKSLQLTICIRSTTLLRFHSEWWANAKSGSENGTSTSKLFRSFFADECIARALAFALFIIWIDHLLHVAHCTVAQQLRRSLTLRKTTSIACSSMRPNEESWVWMWSHPSFFIFCCVAGACYDQHDKVLQCKRRFADPYDASRNCFRAHMALDACHFVQFSSFCGFYLFMKFPLLFELLPPATFACCRKLFRFTSFAVRLTFWHGAHAYLVDCLCRKRRIESNELKYYHHNMQTAIYSGHPDAPVMAFSSVAIFSLCMSCSFAFAFELSKISHSVFLHVCRSTFMRLTKQWCCQQLLQSWVL